MDEGQPHKTVYSDRAVVDFYAQFEQEWPAEQAWLRDTADVLSGARLLDIGVGAGRTTALLQPRCAEYVGVDYSEPLVEAARTRFPDADLRVGDARSLSWIETGSVDVAVFSFNGLDTMGRDDRGRVIEEVARVLRPEGWFLFSSHNQDAANYRRLPRLQKPRASRVWARRTARQARGLARHLWMRRRQESGDGWSIINDEAHDFRLMHFYVTKEHQVATLAAAGFEVAQVYRSDGRHWDGPDTESVELHYWCQKKS